MGGDADDDEYLKLPVEDRCVHKLWKARVSGYEEATKFFNRWDGDDSNFKKFVPLAKKFITDSNAIAQEKGLEAALAFVNNCNNATKVVSDCMEGIVAKCLAAPKTKTKDLAKQIVLMFVEIETNDKVLEELVKGLSQKNPKVVSGCVNCMTTCLKSFGAKVIKVSPLLKAVLPLLDHRDKVVREEGKSLIVEAYRWVGDIMKSQLTGLQPVQMKELESEFANVVATEEKVKPERYLRSQQHLHQEDRGCQGTVNVSPEADDETEDDTGAPDDPYDLLDPVNILDKLPKNFYELVEEKKWQLRKEALDALLPLSQTPKIQSGDFGDLTRVLKKFVSKDTNVMLVTLAAQCSSGLAKGLRVHFKQGATQLLPVVLEKFKEKKVNVVTALQDACDAFYVCLGLETIQEDCLEFLKHKTPSVNTETAKFLARCFAKCPGALVTNKKMVKGYVSCLLDRLSNSDPNVRESASEALGVLMKVLGEAPMLKMLPDLDSIKLQKIKDFAEKAVLTGKLPKAPVQVSAPPPPSTTTKPVGKSGSKVVKPKSSSGNVGGKAVVAPQKTGGSTTARAVGSAPTGVASRKASSVVGKKGGAGAMETETSPPYVSNALKTQRFKDESRMKVFKWNFSTPRAEFVDQLKDQMETASMNSTLMHQMFHSDFKQHLKAIDTLSKYIDADLEGLVANLDLILKWMTLRFFDTNPSVLMKGLEYLNDVFLVLADDSYDLHDIEAVSFIPYLVIKVGDPKDQIRNSVKAIFKSMCRIYPYSKFSHYLIEGLKAKNAKARTECLDEIGHMIKMYGVSFLQPTPSACLKEMAKLIAERDNYVRNAALNAITEVYFQVGEKVYKMIGNLPDKDMAMLEERIKRVSKNRGPFSGVNGGGAASTDTSSSQQVSAPLPRAPETYDKPPESNLRAPPLKKNFRQWLQQPRDGVQSAAVTEVPIASKRSQSARNRAVFSLDLDKLEACEEREAGAAATTQQLPHPVTQGDLDELFKDEPILPLRRKTGAEGGGGASHPMYLTSPVRKDRITSSAAEVKEIEVILAQVSNVKNTSCLFALCQLEELLKDTEKVPLLGPRMDKFLVAFYMQYLRVLDSCHQQDEEAMISKEYVRLLQYLTTVIMAMYHYRDLARKASMSSLHDLHHVMLSLMLEPKLSELPDQEGVDLVKALNVLTVKMLDRSDPTNITCALIKLLRGCVGGGGGNTVSSSPKLVELVMKCLWKMIRQLPNQMTVGGAFYATEESNVSLNVDLVLLELHEFLKAHPSSYWKKQKQETDLPMRTIKTIIHTMVKEKGVTILDNLSLINDPNNSELVSYLQKLVDSGVGGGGKENIAGGAHTVENGSNKPQQSSKLVPRLTKSECTALGETFKKIAQKDLTKQGLQELYNFKQQNPQADLEPFLAKSSHHFRTYIERGLATIESEQQLSSGLEANAPTSVADSSTQASLYLNRLKQLRARAGLDSASLGGTTTGVHETSSTSSHVHVDNLNKLQSGVGPNSGSGLPSVHKYIEESRLSSSSNVTNAASNTMVNSASVKPDGYKATDFEEIRRRLERVKNSAL